MNFDINILVNGSRCKQYQHAGKTFIQANPGSEYVIEIKNSYWKRILAVGSVDGLNILTGKTASTGDSGYIIGAYSAEKIKGFRFSDTEWAMFKFGYKFDGKTYAQSKEDGSERNCGVIGMRIFYENEPVYHCAPPIIWNTTPQWLSSTPAPNPQFTVTTTTTYNPQSSYTVSASYSLTGAYQNNVNYCSNDLGKLNLSNYIEDHFIPVRGNNTTTLANSKGPTRGGKQTMGGRSKISAQYSCNGIASAGLGCIEMERQKAEFDVGTEWGRKEQSRVRNIVFDRGCLAQSFDIFYASREALIAMGVPLTNEIAVNLPQSFPNGYAVPPKNWVG